MVGIFHSYLLLLFTGRATENRTWKFKFKIINRIIPANIDPHCLLLFFYIPIVTKISYSKKIFTVNRGAYSHGSFSVSQRVYCAQHYIPFY